MARNNYMDSRNQHVVSIDSKKLDTIADNMVFKVLLYTFTVNDGLKDAAIKVLEARIEAGQTYWKYLLDILKDTEYEPVHLNVSETDISQLKIYKKMRSKGLRTEVTELLPELLCFDYTPMVAPLPDLKNFKPYNIVANVGKGYGCIGVHTPLKIDLHFHSLFYRLSNVDFEYIEFQVGVIGHVCIFYVIKNDVKNTYDLLCPIESYSSNHKDKVMSRLLRKYLSHYITSDTTFRVLCKEDTCIF